MGTLDSRAGTAGRILIVDDSEAMRSLLAGMVCELGYEPVEAADGKEALEVMGWSQGFVLALVDGHMPVMDGLELLCQVRADARWRSLPVVMLTSELAQEHVEAAVVCGVSAYLHKSIGRRELARRITLLLGLATP